jgi:hypothetical protein
MKKFLKILGFLIALAFIGIGGFWGWYKYQESTYSTTAVPYIVNVIRISVFEKSAATFTILCTLGCTRYTYTPR